MSNNEQKLAGKIAVITGGNSGMGLAVAKRFVEEGAHVVITGRREEVELTRFWRGPKRKSWVREDTCKMMHTSMTYVRNTYFYFTIKQRLCQEKSSFVLIIRFS